MEESVSPMARVFDNNSMSGRHGASGVERTMALALLPHGVAGETADRAVSCMA